MVTYWKLGDIRIYTEKSKTGCKYLSVTIRLWICTGTEFHSHYELDLHCKSMFLRHIQPNKNCFIKPSLICSGSNITLGWLSCLMNLVSYAVLEVIASSSNADLCCSIHTGTCHFCTTSCWPTSILNPLKLSSPVLCIYWAFCYFSKELFSCFSWRKSVTKYIHSLRKLQLLG